MQAAAVADQIVLRYPDPAARFVAVALVSELFKREPPRPFTRRRPGEHWELRFPQPDADRLEYLLLLRYAHGLSVLACDPDAPAAPGPFGEKSVLELPLYAAPAWLEVDAEKGVLRPLDLPSRRLRARVEGALWAPPGTPSDEPLPFLVVHDGPEYAAYSQLLRFLDALAGARRLPPLRAALLAPVLRNEHYSASARYAAALADELLPALAVQAPSPPGRRWRVGMGASLGALALLHAHRRHPGTFGALFLQSGSFFRQRFDRQEAGFPRFRRITRFMGTVLDAASPHDPIPIGMTCGSAEENLRNNRAVAVALTAHGYPVALHEQRDAHNWVAWRDSLDPHLVALLERAWT